MKFGLLKTDWCLSPVGVWSSGHRSGMVHGDSELMGIMWGLEPDAMNAADVGMARSPREGANSSARQGMLTGTRMAPGDPIYLSQEQSEPQKIPGVPTFSRARLVSTRCSVANSRLRGSPWRSLSSGSSVNVPPIF